MNEEKEVKIEQNVQVEETKEAKRKINPILIIILLIVVIAFFVGAFILGTKFADSEQEEKNKNEIQNITEKSKYKVYLYKTLDGEYTIESHDPEGKKNSVALVVPTLEKDAQILDFSTKTVENKTTVSFVLYNDQTPKIYDVVNKKTTDIKIENKYESYLLHTSYDSTQVNGIIYVDENKMYGYYNILQGKNMYENQYTYLSAVKGNYIQGSNVEETDDYSYVTHYLLNIEKEEVVLTGDEPSLSYEIIITKGKEFILEYYAMDGYSTIYNASKEKLMDATIYYEWYLDENGDLSYIENNQMKKIAYDGKIITTTSKSKKVWCISNGYVLYQEAGKIYVEDTNGNSTFLLDNNKKYEFSHHGVAYIDESSLNSDYKEVGFYFLLYSTESDKSLTIYFNPQTKEVKTTEE